MSEESVSTDNDTQTGPAPRLIPAISGVVGHPPGTIIVRITIPNEAAVKPTSLEALREQWRPLGWLVEMETM